jgi:ABC-type transport system involved in cytochrome bd biosynthesis fused ATPase/permease subunit
LVSHSVNFRVLGNIRGWFYRVIEPLIPGAVEDLHEGDLLGRSLQDIESLEDFYVRGIAPPLSAIVITVAVSLFTMQYSMLMAGILAFGLLSTGLVLTILVKIFSANIARQVVQTRSTLTGLVVETINGSAEILMNNADTHYLEKVGLAIDSNRQTSLRLGNLQAVSQASGVLISNLTLAAMLWAGIPLVTSGTIDCVILAVLTLITLASFEPVNLLPAASSKIETSLAAAQRLFELADRPRPVQEPAQPTNLTEFQSLRVIDLDFSYAGTDFKVLRGINLNLHPGKHVALVGPSSSGKTTLLRILQHHLQPPEGTVFWNGLDAKNLNSHTIQSLQGVGPDWDGRMVCFIGKWASLSSGRKWQFDKWRRASASLTSSRIVNAEAGIFS